jgi:glycosyltransferase involved in cell wall biosynthesis
MKLLTLCLSPGHGGLELHVLRSLDHYLSAGIEHHLVLEENTFLSETAPLNIQVTKLPAPSTRFLPLLNAWRLAKIINAQQPDIIHIHWNKDLPLTVLARQLSHFRPKIFFTRHMAIRHKKRDLYHRYFYKRIDRYLTVTKNLLNEALTLLPIAKNKLQHLYLGVPPPPKNGRQRADFFAEQNLDPKQFTIGLLGRIEVEKAQHLAIEALVKLREKNIPAQLIIAGYAMDQHYLEKLKQDVIAQHLEAYVRFIDFLQEPMRIMGTLDVLVLTTNQETFGLVLAEAMRCEVAVIGSNAGGVPEIITHQKTGLLFTPGDSTDLANNIAYLIEHPEERTKLAIAGRLKADSEFNQDMHFQELLSLYRKNFI